MIRKGIRACLIPICLQRFRQLTHQIHVYNAKMQGINVTLRPFVVLTWGCLIATAAMAGEEHRTHIKIAVDGDDTEHRVIEFDSQDSGVNLHDLEVGETRTLTDKSGQEVVVTRTEDGMEFDVEGEKIELNHMIGDFDGEHEIEIMHDGHKTEDVIVKKHKKEHMIKAHASSGVTIISGDEIDDATRAKIEAALKEAGKDGDVQFIDGSELGGEAQAHGEHEVRIIKNEIDVTN